MRSSIGASFSSVVEVVGAGLATSPSMATVQGRVFSVPAWLRRVGLVGAELVEVVVGGDVGVGRGLSIVARRRRVLRAPGSGGQLARPGWSGRARRGLPKEARRRRRHRRPAQRSSRRARRRTPPRRDLRRHGWSKPRSFRKCMVGSGGAVVGRPAPPAAYRRPARSVRERPVKKGRPEQCRGARSAPALRRGAAGQAQRRPAM
jgi:hypothetical protein